MTTLEPDPAVVLIASSTAAHADADLRERLTKPVVGALNSTEQPFQLQLCAADAIGEGLLPVPFPADAAGTIHIFGFGGLMGAGTVQRVVTLAKTSSGTRLEIRSRSSRPDDKLLKLLRDCI